MNFEASHSVAHLAVARLGAGGSVTFYNGSSGTVRIVADLDGYYVGGTAADAGAFQGVSPARVMDTATGLGVTTAAPVAPASTTTLLVAGEGGVPATGVSAVVLNVTVASAQHGGFATVFATGSSRPATSALNFRAGHTASNLVLTAVSVDGKVDIYNGSPGTARLVIDVFGYVLAGTPSVDGAFHPLAPQRLVDTRTSSPGPRGPITKSQMVILSLGGEGGLPANVDGPVVLNVTVTGATKGGYVTADAGSLHWQYTGRLLCLGHLLCSHDDRRLGRDPHDRRLVSAGGRHVGLDPQLDLVSDQ